MKAPAPVPTPAVKSPKKTQKKGKNETKLNISTCDVDENTRDCFSDSATSSDKVIPKPEEMTDRRKSLTNKKGKKNPSESDTVDDVSSRDDSSTSALQFSKKGSFLDAKNTNSLQEDGDSQSQSQSQSQEELKNELGDLSQSAEPKKRKKRRGSAFDLEHAHRYAWLIILSNFRLFRLLASGFSSIFQGQTCWLRNCSFINGHRRIQMPSHLSFRSKSASSCM